MATKWQIERKTGEGWTRTGETFRLRRDAVKVIDARWAPGIEEKVVRSGG